MNARLARLLTQLYPEDWRQRYGAEFETFLQTRPGGVQTVPNVLWSALCERLNPTRGLPTRQHARSFPFPSKCARAPWAVFGLAPLAFLCAAYFLACLILWSGWRIFLPGMDTPFVPIDGFAIFYFGVGRLLYYSAPVLAAWLIDVMAFRLRVRAVWPMVGLILLAALGATAQVHASRPANHGAGGDVTMNFALGSLFRGSSSPLIHALTIFTLAALPYFIISRLQKRHPLQPE